MVTSGTRRTGEVMINGVRYAIQGRVQRGIASSPPQQFRQGDISEESHPLASVASWRDQRGGIGIDIMEDGPADFTRCWFSTCSLRHKGHIVLQRLATQTAAGAVGGGVELLGEHSNRIFAVHSTTVLVYDNAGDSWSVSREMTGPGTDIVTAPVGGTSTLVVARESGVDYTTNAGITWNQNETSIKYLVFWRDMLFGMSSSGTFYFTNDLSGSWTELTTFNPVIGKVTQLFVGPGRDDSEEIIYASATDGLYFYDNEAERFVKTKLALPYHPNNGKGAVAWRESVYYPAGLAIYRYTPGQINVVDLVGPDRDDGLPEVNQGIIQKLVTTHNDLIAIIGPTSQTQSAGAKAFRGATAGPSAHRGSFSGVLTTASGASIRGLVLGWDGNGWEVKWQDDSAQGNMQAALVSGAYSTYRLWWAAGARVYWMQIPLGIVNPSRISTTSYASSGTWETPWFDASVVDFDKTALAVHLNAVDVARSSGSIVLDYALNNLDSVSSNYVNITTVTTDGDSEYFLPADSSRQGLPFNSFKLRANMSRTSSTARFSPDIRSIGLVFRKRVETLYGFVFNINMRDSAGGRSAQERRALLEGLVESQTLFKFGYVDDSDSTQEFWVQMTALTSLDGTGYDGSDLAQVTLTEVH